jgi:hypothetical protein
MSSSSLGTIIATLQDLERMHQLNLELLEQLNVTCAWLIEHNIPIPNMQTLLSLLGKTRALLAEIQADEPSLLQYQAIRRKVTDSESDDKVTEPFRKVTHI